MVTISWSRTPNLTRVFHRQYNIDNIEIYLKYLSTWCFNLGEILAFLYAVISVFRSFLLGITVIEDEPNEFWQICHFLCCWFFTKSRLNRQLDRDMSYNWVVLRTLATASLETEPRKHCERFQYKVTHSFTECSRNREHLGNRNPNLRISTMCQVWQRLLCSIRLWSATLS